MTKAVKTKSARIATRMRRARDARRDAREVAAEPLESEAVALAQYEPKPAREAVGL